MNKTENTKAEGKNHKKEAEPIKEEVESKEQVKEEKINAEEPKKEAKKIEKPKKTEAVVNGYNVPASTKESIEICRFIKGKDIAKAINELEEVVKLRKAVPMRGEIPHRKGKGISSGRYPQRAAKNFIVLLKSLAANASDMENPIISEASANMASRPYGRFGRIRKKRTHIKIIAKEKQNKK